MDGEKYIGVPMQRYVGGIKENPNGALITHGNNFREMDLEPGNYVKLKGYRGHFLIDQNQEAWDGLYRLRLIRRNPPKDYSREIVILNNYAEATD